jgi:putative transposase
LWRIISITPVSTCAGVDLGVKTLAYCSNGQVFKNNRFKKKRLKQIKRLQRELSRRIKGGKNREKSRIKLARVYETITNQKNNYLHYVTKKIIN